MDSGACSCAFSVRGAAACWAAGERVASASSAGETSASAASGLDVDSGNGCSSSVAGSRVGVSNSVFRVMLSGSGLRTFAIAAAPGFITPGDERVSPGLTPSYAASFYRRRLVAFPLDRACEQRDSERDSRPGRQCRRWERLVSAGITRRATAGWRSAAAH